MRRPSSVAAGILRIVLTCAGLTGPGAALAQAPAEAPDPVARLALMGAAFADAPLPTPARDRVTAMAFLPGRGVVSWDVTGKTPEQAREAEIEAMGAADARAVQREIDAARSEQTARAAAAAAEPGPDRAGLAAPRLAAIPRPTDAAVARLRRAAGAPPLTRAARMQAALGVRSGGAMRERPRVYAFAAVSGQGLGFNMTHDDGAWRNGGLTTDRSGFQGQRQAGLAWRTGGTQTSLSLVQQKTDTPLLGLQKIKDRRLMLTATLRPGSLVRLFTGRR